MNIDSFVVLAQRGADSPANQWLNEHPHVLGLIALLIGAALAGSGVYELRKGIAHDKFGNEIRGGMGKVASIFRVVFGVAACGFGLYKIVAG
ncbi:MAG: hypothetical protein GXP26_06760 [Planctomycetes bacterium]|nr:hypothetical protein [Planctomycetota bacterium]